jgi:hypothetical protein
MQGIVKLLANGLPEFPVVGDDTQGRELPA